jgi:transcriptional regulator with XRE-family HTH domain
MVPRWFRNTGSAPKFCGLKEEERAMAKRHLEKERHKGARTGLGVAINVLRTRDNLSQKAMARKVRVKAGTYASWEQGASKPGHDNFQRIADSFRLSPPALEAFADLFDAIPALLGAGREGGERAAASSVRMAVLLTQAGKEIFEERRTAPSPAPEDRSQAPELWDRLQRYKTAAERQAIVLEIEDFWIWPFCELLCDESLKAAPDSAGRALELAGLALAVAYLVSGAEAWRACLRRYAWAHFGNALRVCGQLPAADAAFCRAAELEKPDELGAPAGLLNEARVLGLEASLRRAQRLLTQALNLLDRALAMDLGEEAPYLFLNRAKILEEQGAYEEAIAALRRALPHIDAEREPRMFWNLRHNLLVNAVRVGRVAEAAAEVHEVRELAERLGNEVDLVRQGWLEALIAAGQGNLSAAEAAFERTRKAFLARSIAYDAALVTLELAVLLLEQGRTAEVKTIAAELLPMFEAQNVIREALATVKLFCDAARRERLTAEIAERCLQDLRRGGRRE